MLSWIGYESKRATDYLSAMRSDLSKPGMAAPPAFISQQVYSKSYCFQLGPEYPASRQLEKLGPNVVWQFNCKDKPVGDRQRFWREVSGPIEDVG